MNKPDRIPYDEIDGVLLLDKPVGPTSNHALQQARRLCRAKKAGHTGTLDPMASGLLPLCFGEATKFSSFVLEADKGYLATVFLGVVTETADAEGQIIDQRSIAGISEEDILQVLADFVGTIEQVPPMFSALKYQGKPLYEYAHAGKTVDRKARQVTIYSIDCVSVCLPEVTIRVVCSKGTYIRTLAQDIGEKLGCGAHLSALRREKTGAWSIEQGVSMAQLSEEKEPRDRMLPVDSLLAHLPEVCLTAEETGRLYLGQKLGGFSDRMTHGMCRLYLDGQVKKFIGLGQSHDGKTLQSARLLRNLPE